MLKSLRSQTLINTWLKNNIVGSINKVDVGSSEINRSKKSKFKKKKN